MLDLVLITWVDSEAQASVWRHLSDFNETGSLEIQSVGFVIDDNDEYVSITAHLGDVESEGDRQYNGAMRIPHCSILNMEKLDD